MTSGSVDQPIDLSTKIKLLDGDIRKQEFLMEKMASKSDDQPIDLSTKIYLLDGNIRSQIIRSFGIFPNRAQLYRYNRKDKDLVHNLYIDYLNSGSNLIRTNTYHALYPYLKTSAFQLTHRSFVETIKCAVQIAQESIRNYCSNNNIHESSLCIVGSCGCFDSKAMNLEPLELRDAHRERIHILIQNDIKILSLEGIRDYKEAEMLLDIVMLECPDIKTLVMFDGDWMDLTTLAVWIKDCYYSYRSQITAIGLKNINDVKARDFCELIIQQNTENLIPLVMCTKRDGESWDPIKVNNNAPVREWHKFGIRYIGGDDNVISEDIESLRKKLNGT